MLKQSPESCYLDEAITSLDLSIVLEDHCVYVKRKTSGIMFLTLYVDILLAGNNLGMIKATEQWLSSIIEMKDMGEVR